MLSHPTELEKAYLAGILDGEGYITIRLRYPGKYFSPHIEVSNTRHLLLEWLQRRWGGSIIEDTYARRNRRNSSVCWKWRVECFRVKQILESVLPYLVIKQEQAKTVLALPYGRRGKGIPRHRRSREDIQFSDGLVSRVRELNHVGGLHAMGN